MKQLLLVGCLLGVAFCSLSGCGSDSGSVEIKTVPPMTEAEKQQMNSYEQEQQKAEENYR